MSDPSGSRVLEWFNKFVRAALLKTEPPATIEEIDKLGGQLEQLGKNREQLFPICLLGQAGVGKSTLINTLIADNTIVVPSGGGTGPLTANALRVVYGETPSFTVRYHTAKQLGQTRFILESAIRRESKTSTPDDTEKRESDAEYEELKLDDEKQRGARTEEAVGQAKLLIAASQSAPRELPYLADALRWIIGQPIRFGSQVLPEDLLRMNEVKEALRHANSETSKLFASADNPNFGRQLRDHACGYLAPLIVEMSIKWPSDVLKNGLELVDLPGLGILSDAYASVTSDYLRSRAKAVMLVADSRGIRKEDADLLRSSGFLNRLLHAGMSVSAVVDGEPFTIIEGGTARAA